MDRRDFTRFGLTGGLVVAGAGAAAAADGGGTAHRVAIQVSADDHRTQELALGNARNYAEHYKAMGAPYRIEIVAFGPGYNMLRDDISMVKGNIEALKAALGDSIAFSACQNSRAAIAASLGKQPDSVPQVKEATSTPSGIVRLAELQEQGWAYIRP